jgi:hypothetical protein
MKSSKIIFRVALFLSAIASAFAQTAPAIGDIRVQYWNGTMWTSVKGGVQIPAKTSYFFGPSGLGTETGVQNTGVGALSLSSLTTGYANVAVGVNADNAATTGYDNVALGDNALLTNTNGFDNVAIGDGALENGTGEQDDVAIGLNALQAATGVGLDNIGIGIYAGEHITTAQSNTAVGAQALQTDVTGANNSAFGASALQYTTSNNNSGFGLNSLYTDSTGANNTAMGANSLYLESTGAHNTGIGVNALASDAASSGNSAVGELALFDLIATGNAANTAIGYDTGRGIITGANNTILGANVTGLSSSLTGAIILATGDGTIQAEYQGGGWGFGRTPSSTRRMITEGASGTSSDYAFAAQNSSNANLFDVRDDGMVTDYQLTAGAMYSDSSGGLHNQSNNYAAYLTGTAYSFTSSYAAIAGGSTSPSVTLGAAGTYLIRSGIVTEYNAATFAGNQTVSTEIYRTNNTASAITNTPQTCELAIVTTTTNSGPWVQTNEVIYTTANTTDILSVYGKVSTTPSSGSFQATGGYIMAQRLY